MKNKNIIVSIVLIVIGVGVIFYKNKQTVHLKKNVLSMPWSDIRKDKLISIETIAYQHTNELKYTIKKEQGIWYLTSPISIKTQQDKSMILANDFLNLRPTSILSNVSTEEFNNFGLNKPLLKIAGIFKDASTNFFIVGSKTSIGNEYYAADNVSSNIVYIIHESNLSPFIQGVSSIIDTYFISQAIDQATFVELKTFDGSSYQFTNIQQVWSQISPSNTNCIDWGLRKFLLDTKNLQFDPEKLTFSISDKNLSALGINTNTSPLLSIKYNDGNASLFYIGNKNKNNNQYPVYSVFQKIIAFSDEDTIKTIFDISTKDFENKNN